MSLNRGMIAEDAKTDRSLPTTAELAVVKEAAKAAAAPTRRTTCFS